MDVLKAARSLGQAIQADERYKRYVRAREASDNDENLQKLIGEFNLKRLAARQETKNQGENPDITTTLDHELQKIYDSVMANENMKEYSNAKREFDLMLKDINTIIDLSCKGFDPATINPDMYQCGSGGCEGCSGCR